MIGQNAVAHIQPTVSGRKRSWGVHHRILLQSFGMTIRKDEATTFYCIGRRAGIAISEISDTGRGVAFDQWCFALHPFCFRFRSGQDIPSLREVLADMGPDCPAAGARRWAPGYPFVRREDPDGIRLDAVFIPGGGYPAVIRDKTLIPSMT